MVAMGTSSSVNSDMSRQIFQDNLQTKSLSLKEFVSILKKKSY